MSISSLELTESLLAALDGSCLLGLSAMLCSLLARSDLGFKPRAVLFQLQTTLVQCSICSNWSHSLFVVPWQKMFAVGCKGWSLTSSRCSAPASAPKAQFVLLVIQSETSSTCLKQSAISSKSAECHGKRLTSTLELCHQHCWVSQANLPAKWDCTFPCCC